MRAADPAVGNRFFIVCTPRTGNTWLRKLIAGNLDLPEYPAHRLDELPWDELPAACAISMHVHATPELQRFLAERGFRVIVTIRHPLDVLVSILQFSKYQPKTGRWVGGDGGDESTLWTASPLDPAFFDYALGPRATVLLGVSVEWLPFAAAVVRYESLAANPEAHMMTMFGELGVTPRHRVRDIIEENTIAKLRGLHAQDSHHFWRGERGLWRRLLPGDVCQPIATRHRSVFERLGYVCDFDPSLTRERAEQNWSALTMAEPDVAADL